MESADSFEVLTHGSNPILNISDNEYSLEKTHDLYYQVQLQINVAELKYCDLIIWSPKPNLSHLSLRIESDFDFWRTNMAKAHTFHEEIMMPEILGKSFTRTGCICDDDNNISIDELTFSDEDGYDFTPSFQYEAEKEKERLLTTSSKPKINIGNSQNYKSSAKLEDINVRNLMKYSIEEILITFFDHENELKQLYGKHIKQLKRNYRPKDLPDMIALDIVTEKQLQAMANFAESKLVHNHEEEHNSTDVIFDTILPEWALAAYCKKFSLTRTEAVQTLKLQLMEICESEI